MLVVLVTLLVSFLIVQPLLLWGSARLCCGQVATFGRSMLAFVVMLSVGVAWLAMQVAFGWNSTRSLIASVLGFGLNWWLVSVLFKTRLLRALVCMAIMLVAGLGVALLVRATLTETFFVSASSMEPTILRGDRTIVDKLTYRLRQPQRGEVIAFRPPPPRQPYPPLADDTVYIKRLVAIEGDRVERRGDELLVNGVSVGDGSMAHGNPGFFEFPIVVPPGKLFVLGDNRKESADSRYWGYVDRNKVVGLAAVIYGSVELPPLYPQNAPTEESPSARRIRWDRIGKIIR